MEKGAELRYHGDFDWPGIRIFARLLKRYPMVPWRFSSSDYLEAPTGGVKLGERKSSETPWDPELQIAMENRGHAVHQEQVVDWLLADLEATGS